MVAEGLRVEGIASQRASSDQSLHKRYMGSGLAGMENDQILIA